MARKVEVDFKLIIGALALVILATVGSAFATYLIFGSGGNTPALGGGDSGGTAEANSAPKAIGPIYQAGDFTVNIGTGTTQTRFIRTGIALEMSSDRNLRQELESRHPQIRDRIISILRSHTVEQLNRPDGLEMMRIGIINSINELLLHGEIIDVFFMDLVIQ